MLQIKQAAARANVQIGELDAVRGELIAAACSRSLRIRSSRAEFPVHILHGGGGTSANMNVNEVVAHVANELAGLSPRSRRRVDPLDHVNRNQSTNDVYPSACRLALLAGVAGLKKRLEVTEQSWSALRERLGAVPRLARTCLQDAVASDFAALFGGCAAATARCRDRLERAQRHLPTISLGGGLAGQQDATPVRYRTAVIAALQRSTAGEHLQLTPDFADAAQNADELLELAQALDALARVLIKQAQDLRILASGPEGGIGEVLLAPLQPGSSALPGKVNPVVPEFVVQCSMQAVAAAVACGMATDHAELDLNVWEGVYVHNLSTALSLLTTALDAWNERCLSRMEVVEPVNRKRAGVLAARLAAIVQTHSYQHAQRELETTRARRPEAT